MSADNILLERQDHIAVLTISNPEKRNAIDQSMWEAIANSMDSIRHDPSARVLIVKGAGEEAFSAGADISEFTELAKDPKRLNKNNRIVQAAQEKLEELNRPTIAMIQGACFGGGCGLALACDFRFAAEGSRFAITPAKLGLIYSVRDTRRLLDLVGPSLTKEMLYTAKTLSDREALQYGIINRLIPAVSLEAETLKFAEQLNAGAQYSIRGIKEVIALLEGYGDKTEQDIEQMYDDAFNMPDCQEGVSAFLAKRKPDFSWG